MAGKCAVEKVDTAIAMCAMSISDHGMARFSGCTMGV